MEMKEIEHLLSFTNTNISLKCPPGLTLSVTDKLKKKEIIEIREKETKDGLV